MSIPEIAAGTGTKRSFRGKSGALRVTGSGFSRFSGGVDCGRSTGDFSSDSDGDWTSLSMSCSSVAAPRDPSSINAAGRDPLDSILSMRSFITSSPVQRPSTRGSQSSYDLVLDIASRSSVRSGFLSKEYPPLNDIMQNFVLEKWLSKYFP